MRYPVLVHGFTGASSAWDGVVDALTSAGHIPALVDLPGHGRHVGESDPARFTLEGAFAAVEVGGAWPADLIGYSMGGRVALHFAAAFPGRVRRLVLESASPGVASGAERESRRVSDHALADLIVTEGVPAFVERWEALPLFETQSRADPALLLRQRARRLANDPASLAAALRGLGTGALPSLWDRLPTIVTPTLLVVGDEDAKFVDIAKRMAEQMPRARVFVAKGCGHCVHLERPSSWVEAVTGFLADG